MSWNLFIKRICNSVPHVKLRGSVDSLRRPSRFIWPTLIEVTTKSEPVNSLHLRLNPCLTMRDYWHSNRRSWKSQFHPSIGFRFFVRPDRPARRLTRCPVVLYPRSNTEVRVTAKKTWQSCAARDTPHRRKRRACPRPGRPAVHQELKVRWLESAPLPLTR